MKVNTLLLCILLIEQTFTAVAVLRPDLVPVVSSVEVSVSQPEGIVEVDKPIQLSPLWPPEIQQWREPIIDAANQYRISPNLIAAVMMYESGGNPNAVSRAGARGLLQIMPLHSCWSFEPRQNILCGTYILVNYYHRMGDDWRLGLAAYNCGITGVRNNDCGAKGGLAYADVVLGLWRQSEP